MKANRGSLGILIAALVFGSFLVFADRNTDRPKLSTGRQTVRDADYRNEQVRRKLVTLPWYGVFDHLEYSVRGSTVILSGQVTRPTLRSDAEASVRQLEWVSNVINDLEVLPLSPNDDRIRMDTYRALFSTSGLDRYALSAVPSIHIIVENGHVTLKGVVSREADRDLAGIVARGVSGAFSVTNELALEG
ncbi:MAG: BON domain-containing protein [Acidobacteria bacterium]|nr:BON domain-containing protein [Acidobacteriota bacterium]